jgi:2-isopropylmalate synthase
MKRILMTDTTLCAERAAALSFREKLEIAKLLDKMKVDCIDFGTIRNPKTDPLLISTIAPLLNHSTLCITSTLDEQQTMLAAKAVTGLKHARLSLSVPVSTVGMEYTCHKKPAAMLEAVDAQLRKLRSTAAEVELCALDATRSDPNFLKSIITTALDAGATYITLCDNDGRMLPDEAAAFVVDVMKTIENRSATISLAFPDHMQMAVACSVAAIRAGADGIRVCVGGKDSADVYALSEVIRARGESCGVCCELSTTELRRCISQIEAITRIISPMSGAAAASGVSADNEPISLDKNDDCISVARAVRKLGYDLSAEDEAHVFEAFMRVAEKKAVNARELEAIIASTALQVPPTYRLVSYLTNSGNIISSSAHIKLEKDGKTLEGIVIGDGPIDAAFMAIEQIIGHHYELDDFQIQSVTEGHEAMGNALVRLRSGGKIYSGNGISTDIIGASIRAYLNALNKIVYEEAAE